MRSEIPFACNPDDGTPRIISPAFSAAPVMTRCRVCESENCAMVMGFDDDSAFIRKSECLTAHFLHCSFERFYLCVVYARLGIFTAHNHLQNFVSRLKLV